MTPDLIPGCLAIEASLQPTLQQANALTQCAQRFRYPGAPYEPDAAEARCAPKPGRILPAVPPCWGRRFRLPP